MNSFLSRNELVELGFCKIGDDVLLSRKASIYGASRISLGNHVRIDDFCVFSAGEGGISIGNYVHIAVYTSLIGGGAIQINDFANISSRVSIYSSNDDYSGQFMTNPVVPSMYTNVTKADVVIGRHVIIGSGSIVLPGVIAHEGAAIGALSLVKNDCDSFYIYSGSPAKKLKRRSDRLLDFEKLLINGN